MKKALYVSLAINIIIIIFFIGKRVYYGNYSLFNQPCDYNAVRQSVFQSLIIDSNDVVFVGTSLTESFMVTEFFGPHCKNRGINGNTTADILNRIKPIAEKQPRKIFIEGGINDIAASVSLQDIFVNYKSIIDTIRKYSPGTAIFIQSISPAGKEHDYNERIIEFNKLIKDYCKRVGVTLIDLFTPLQKDGYLLQAYTYDGMHLNGKGYEIWRDIISRYV